LAKRRKDKTMKKYFLLTIEDDDILSNATIFNALVKAHLNPQTVDELNLTEVPERKK
jgi:hypothetical protein